MAIVSECKHKEIHVPDANFLGGTHCILCNEITPGIRIRNNRVMYDNWGGSVYIKYTNNDGLEFGETITLSLTIVTNTPWTL